jgi:hypothetical protein
MPVPGLRARVLDRVSGPEEAVRPVCLLGHVVILFEPILESVVFDLDLIRVKNKEKMKTAKIFYWSTGSTHNTGSRVECRLKSGGLYTSSCMYAGPGAYSDLSTLADIARFRTVEFDYFIEDSLKSRVARFFLVQNTKMGKKYTILPRTTPNVH